MTGCIGLGFDLLCTEKMLLCLFSQRTVIYCERKGGEGQFWKQFAYADLNPAEAGLVEP